MSDPETGSIPMFADLSNPLTIATRLVEATLFLVALAVALVPSLVRPVRWLARGLAVVSLLIALGGEAEAVWEMWRFGYPLSLPDAPLGTYEQPTVLGMLGLMVTFSLVGAGGILAFRLPGLGGLLFVASGVLTLLSVTRSRLQDPTFPPGNFSMAVEGVVLPALTVGALLLATWWAEQQGARRTGSPADLTARLFGAPT